MSALVNVIELPVPAQLEERGALERDLVLALATADELASGMEAVVRLVRRDSGAARAEWWVEEEKLVAVDGIARGRCQSLRLGRAGLLVLYGGQLDRPVETALTALAPIIRRRAAEERLARTTAQLAQRNEALEDFAALVAHELKTPLEAALVAADPSESVEEAIQLVDALLEASRSRSGDATFASVTVGLEQAAGDLRAEIAITADVDSMLPLSPSALRVILRNLLSNAVAAHASHVHVTASGSSLYVDDDGVGPAAADGYESGSGLGLSLCRRIAARFGGVLELVPGLSGGTRVTLELPEVPQ